MSRTAMSWSRAKRRKQDYIKIIPPALTYHKGFRKITLENLGEIKYTKSQVTILITCKCIDHNPRHLPLYTFVWLMCLHLGSRTEVSEENIELWTYYQPNLAPPPQLRHSSVQCNKVWSHLF